ncbi:ABC transporter permease [Paractinoplanes rishiriensis]|uniref:ABC3 transporter permease C-terminal domain-containing protein n=1 Tax=Paractinoplanes rishiriensis TaxID=1050105 RepID=A0A919JVU6_9ACTN|nr:ABC transporter permease [Actinoplanes rishiriensis]GIE94499.1 hypothetical protein Ari01nite_19640 [Actinoplanes rishiriensis]
MNILLGIRMAFAGGRESAARMALMAVGVAVGVPLILYALAAVPVLQSHTDRLAWHRTTAQTAPTAPDPALWLAVTDHYQGRDIVRVHVAALGPRPPLPPGVDRLPGPGEKLLSPALAALLPEVPDDQLDNRYPGRPAGSIGAAGLLMPGELVAIIGHAPDELRTVPGAVEIRGIEQPGEGLDLAALWGIFFSMIAVLIIGPVVVFVAMTTRVGGPRREVRFAAVRLAGATRLQTAVLAATETAAAAIAGTLLGWLAFHGFRPAVANVVTLGHGTPIFPADVAVPASRQLIVLFGIPLVAVLTTLVALHPVQMSPLGVRHRARRRPPTVWRLMPIIVGVLGVWLVARAQNAPQYHESSQLVQGTLSLMFTLSALSILAGFFLAGAWVCLWISRGMARVTRSATGLLVARRIAADPYSTFRAVSGAAVAIYVATLLGFAAAAYEQPEHQDTASVLDAGVVAVHVQGVPEDRLGALASPGTVVARIGPGDQIVVPCADLARVSDLACPLPQYEENGDDSQAFLRARDLFILPYPGASAADHIFQPMSYAEPGPTAGRLPVQTLLIPTDGSAAAQERIRTLAATVVPQSRSKTSTELTAGPLLSATSMAALLPYALIFVLLVTACSLTVSVITGVLERRRPLAVLRASGVRLGDLRRIVLLETGAPLAFTVLLGVGLATLVSLVTVPPQDWILPSASFLIGLGVGGLVAFAVSLIALPFMDTATRLDTVRFE